MPREIAPTNGVSQLHDYDGVVHADLLSKLAYQAYDTNDVQHMTKIIRKVFVKKQWANRIREHQDT